MKKLVNTFCEKSYIISSIMGATKIAIIEDDGVIRQMYRMKFEGEGFEVEVAENGKDGVALVQHMKPDIMLLDMHMPEMDGVTALTKIRAEKWGKDIPVIVLTNLGEEESPKNLRALGISGYIVKADFTPRQVVARVKDALSE
ncbi:MAG: response regulator [Candidatus Saccharibacteria bacterium]|nr:response regulator [Candidatus Saccharibacteria bacterium]